MRTHRDRRRGIERVASLPVSLNEVFLDVLFFPLAVAACTLSDSRRDQALGLPILDRGCRCLQFLGDL
jgi:hypothetical protein